ncbi:MAG: oxidoreductase [Proteobacteria bacterium SG_bin5]|nr:NAD(P)-dependent oxidoreductase [Sphingomonas sp.]OQW40594.1 MAG: oxidoreductase [Proteobacteria bacterium SG_bin5]
MRILLTGSSGWLGRHVARTLAAAGHGVVGLDPLPGPATQAIGSVADRERVEALFAAHRFDGVVHAGALHQPDIARHSAQAFVDVNVTGTLNLLEAACRHRVGRFVFTSTTSLMISAEIAAGQGRAAAWLDEDHAPLAPRNIYGITKLAAEQLCRLYHQRHGLACVVLRTARFFPERDQDWEGASDNARANEYLNRRLSVADAAQAHRLALDRADQLGFDLFLIAAPTPFAPSDAVPLKVNAATVIARYFPEAPALYAARGWRLPATLDRVYDARRAERVLGFRATTSFATILASLAHGAPTPVE